MFEEEMSDEDLAPAKGSKIGRSDDPKRGKQVEERNDVTSDPKPPPEPMPDDDVPPTTTG